LPSISEGFIFTCGEKDCSNERERKQFGFRIDEIEMVVNDAFEVEEALA